MDPQMTIPNDLVFKHDPTATWIRSHTCYNHNWLEADTTKLQMPPNWTQVTLTLQVISGLADPAVSFLVTRYQRTYFTEQKRPETFSITPMSRTALKQQVLPALEKICPELAAFDSRTLFAKTEPRNHRLVQERPASLKTFHLGQLMEQLQKARIDQEYRRLQAPIGQLMETLESYLWQVHFEERLAKAEAVAPC